MSFTDQKPRTATAKDLNTRWSGSPPGERFFCDFCGYKFKIGDYWRWVYTNNVKGAGGNPFVCERCDDSHEKLIERRKQILSITDGRNRNRLRCLHKLMMAG